MKIARTLLGLTFLLVALMARADDPKYPVDCSDCESVRIEEFSCENCARLDPDSAFVNCGEDVEGKCMPDSVNACFGQSNYYCKGRPECCEIFYRQARTADCLVNNDDECNCVWVPQQNTYWPFSSCK